MNILDKVNKILNNPLFKECLNKNVDTEKNRQFCKHDLSHFLDVARISYILVLENDINVDKETVYAAAILHDIGKWKQYSKQVPHEIASAEIAEQILKQCGYNEENIKVIINSILSHRIDKNADVNFNSILYKSDKISRNCFNCKSQELCIWSNVKKNFSISY